MLAVIVILAIIAVIATPIITGIIEDSKKASFERSAEGVVEATKFDIPEKLTEAGYIYEFENGEIDLGENVKVNNAKNLSGTIKYNKDGEVSYAIHNDKWCVVKKNNETTTIAYEEGKCVLETSTIASAFTYEDIEVVESFKSGDSCVDYFMSNQDLFEEQAIAVCNGETASLGSESVNLLSSIFEGSIEMLSNGLYQSKKLNVIKNVTMNSSSLSLEAGDSCVSYFQENYLTAEQSTALCNGESITIDGNSGSLFSFSFEAGEEQLIKKLNELSNNNVIKNVNLKPTSLNFEAGDSCVSFFQGNNYNLTIEQSIALCNGEVVILDSGTPFNLVSEMNSKEGEDRTTFIEELKTNNVIKNVVINDAITITDYNIDTGGIDVVIPSTIDGKTVVAIGPNAFARKILSTETSMLNKNNIQFMSNKEDNEFVSAPPGDIRSVVIPSTVKSIGESTFISNKISSVILSNGLETIGESAFQNNQLTTITIPSSVKNIGSSAFYGNQLTSVVIEGISTEMGCSVFERNDNLTSIKIVGADVPIDNMPLCK